VVRLRLESINNLCNRTERILVLSKVLSVRVQWFSLALNSYCDLSRKSLELLEQINACYSLSIEVDWRGEVSEAGNFEKLDNLARLIRTRDTFLVDCNSGLFQLCPHINVLRILILGLSPLLLWVSLAVILAKAAEQSHAAAVVFVLEHENCVHFSHLGN
jgi:hypothetical protein